MYKIEAKEVSVNYKDFQALKNVSFSLEGNKIYGLIGRNGAGKTTFLSLLAAFQEASAGQIQVNGEDVFENPEMMEKIALLYDVDYKDETEKVKNMLEVAKRYRPNYDDEYAMYLLERFKLPLDKPINKLSKGMQSAFNVVMGLACRTPITIFDEVYLGMDAPTREIFYKELLEEQTNRPRMFILSTHLVSEMDHLFDEIVIIDQGEMLLHEDYESLVSKGVSITGDADVVDQFTQDKEILNEQRLGQTKAVMVYGTLGNDELEKARDNGLDVGPVSLQDLFIHLTDGEES
ncbi:ATP-binding cassette domain-containing protein [Alkalibacillus aidingensis]|uniref:ATP-binding cassette domain-containing protein n=1 Tax=Alkalibacillus aidingensis TaxID=2747607 RepID=UPI0016602339|nr:ABC transporter ATP-binding protein [Alkalibacillus aidingensis]